MNTNYYDTVLARSEIAQRISHREGVQIANNINLFAGFEAFVSRIVSAVKEQLQEPTLVPVYCFEYAPDC